MDVEATPARLSQESFGQVLRMVEDESQGHRFRLGPGPRLAERCHLPGGDIGQSRSQVHRVLAGVPRRKRSDSTASSARKVG